MSIMHSYHLDPATYILLDYPFALRFHIWPWEGTSPSGSFGDNWFSDCVCRAAVIVQAHTEGMDREE